ncbi:MAG: aspartate/glutamate racemase family protein, partial [Pedobacter sp.]|nr:aspartate/glutamate racemase family protein [Chitinophagaceae bacterium]
YDNLGANYFVEHHLNNLLQKDILIDTILLACTHYPLLINKIKSFTPTRITILSQGEIVADSLVEYLKHHISLEERCEKGGNVSFYTTDSAQDFDSKATMFFGKPVQSNHIDLGLL